MLQITKIVKSPLVELERLRGWTDREYYAGPTCAGVTLGDTVGNWACCFRLNENAIAARQTIGTMCQLIELSSGSIRT